MERTSFVVTITLAIPYEYCKLNHVTQINQFESFPWLIDSHRCIARQLIREMQTVADASAQMEAIWLISKVTILLLKMSIETTMPRSYQDRVAGPVCDEEWL